MTARILTPEELALLTLVQNELVPAYGDLPAAGTLGAALTVDAYLAERPQLRRPVLTALRAVEAAAGETPFAELDARGASGHTSTSRERRSRGILRACEADLQRVLHEA